MRHFRDLGNIHTSTDNAKRQNQKKDDEMTMMKETLRVCVEEAERFLKRAKELEEVGKNRDVEGYYHNHKEQAAVLRSSMDLTRALADLRQGR